MRSISGKQRRGLESGDLQDFSFAAAVRGDLCVPHLRSGASSKPSDSKAAAAGDSRSMLLPEPVWQPLPPTAWEDRISAEVQPGTHQSSCKLYDAIASLCIRVLVSDDIQLPRFLRLCVDSRCNSARLADTEYDREREAILSEVQKHFEYDTAVAVGPRTPGYKGNCCKI